MYDSLPNKKKKLQRACFKRDKCCQFIDSNGNKCGKKRALKVHHILPKSQYPYLAFSLNNTITICQKHHLWLHQADRYVAYVPIFKKIIKENT